MEDTGTPEVTESMDDFMASAFDELESQSADEPVDVEAKEFPDPEKDTSETADEESEAMNLRKRRPSPPRNQCRQKTVRSSMHFRPTSKPGLRIA
jgi:hypothetical protein